MNLNELTHTLQRQPDLNLAFVLPDGRRVPAHFHVTEVGHVLKNSVDCGGVFRRNESYVVQVHAGSARDDGHRLTAGKLARILSLAGPIVTGGEHPVEVEYEDGLISQFAIEGTELADGVLAIQLARKHTECLAKEKCGSADDGGCASEPTEKTEACCATPAGAGRCC